MTSSRRIAAACVVLACSTRVVAPPPRPASVTPPVGYQQVSTRIVIRGDDFQVLPYQDASGRPGIDTTFSAWLGGVPLADVTWVSVSELRARVPPGLPAGVLRLEVRSPAGERGVLEGAFTVLPGSGASLGAVATLVPGVARPGASATLSVIVTNVGDRTAKGVTVSATAAGGALTLLPPAPAPQDVAPGASAVFVQLATAGAAGSATVSVDAVGIDAGTGEPVWAPHLTTGALVVQAEAAKKVLDDPFGDGTAFSFVFGYGGNVTLGPSADGRRVLACAPVDAGCASLDFVFSLDVTGSKTSPDQLTSVSQNTVCSPVTTLGSATPPWRCDPASPQNTACSCGPDYESGRGIMGSVTAGDPGVEWLAAMGRTEKAGTLNYLYMTRDLASPFGFAYVDLYTALPLGANVTNVASMAVLNDRLYLGLQAADTERPRIAVLEHTPASAGLDCTPADAFATTLQNTPMGESGTGGPSQVDAMLGFEGRLFVANRRAVLVSKDGFPTGAADAGTQFDDCTPPAAGGWEATSIVKYTPKIDLTPADKGVTGLAAWGGRLYLGRNTRPPPPGTSPAVPELWVFTPRHDTASGAFLGCAPADWQRIATNFGDATSTHLTAVLASASYLYVGYDGDLGVRLFRSSAPAPAKESDFTGDLACTAPCTPFGGAGFGDVTNSRFLDARTITFAGVDQVWAVVGSGSGPIRAFRLQE